MSTPRPKRAPVSVTPRVDALKTASHRCFPVLTDLFALASELETDNTALLNVVAALKRRVRTLEAARPPSQYPSGAGHR